MNGRERVIAALKHRKTDRTPRFIWLYTETARKLSEKLGIPLPELEIHLGNDVLQTWLSINASMAREVPEGTEFTDEWGILWRRGGYYNNVVYHPLAGFDAEAIQAYPFPDPMAAGRYEKLELLMKEYQNTHFIGADVSGSLFEPACHLRGMEALMLDLALNNPEAGILLDRLEAFTGAVAAESARRGADWIWLGDDLGSQTGMLMSPEMWREHFKPRMRRIIEAVRAVRPEIPVCYHSCGSMAAVIGDLAEIGVDVLNPLQQTAAGMDQQKIKFEFGDRLTLMCGVDTQVFLPKATPDEVRAETAELIKTLGANGGFILAASHSIQPDTPLENILAVFEGSE